VTGAGSVQLTSAQAGTLTTASGARLEIPAGAVPRSDSGEAGSMVVSIEEDPTWRVILPGDGNLVMRQLGPVYELGPEGFTFDAPVELTLPIPEGVDPDLVTALTTFDSAANVWRLVPGAVDVDARTISLRTTHFSSWGFVGGSIIGAGPIGGDISSAPVLGTGISVGPGTPMPDVGGSIAVGPGTPMPDVGGSIAVGPGTPMPHVGGSIFNAPPIGGSIGVGPGTPMPDVGGSIAVGPGTPMPDVGGSLIFDNDPDAWRQWRRDNGGWIRVENALPEKMDWSAIDIPNYDGNHLPIKVWYGVCIEDFAPDNPATVRGWIAPRNWVIGAGGGQTNRYWVPAGTYTLAEYYGIGETDNTDINTMPKHWTFSRLVGQMRVGPGDTIKFTRPAGDFTQDGFTLGRPTCWGEQTTAVGTGDVQVTLTWVGRADIDLYVTDPSGETVSYQVPLISSGGQLDRDNKASNFIPGRPENIFWPAGEAPNGDYVVKVVYYGEVDSGEVPVDWTVRTVVMGRVQTYQGRLTTIGETQEVTTFTVP
jgi:hypothetical protein